MPGNKLAVSVAEMAHMLGVSRPTAYAITRREDFTAVFRVGNRILISVSGLEEWIKQQTSEGAAN